MMGKVKGSGLLGNHNSYYVDATGGDDSKDGKSPSTAWRTIGKVNSYLFILGDHVLLKRGETWTGTALIIPRSDLSFRAYGSGAKPIIDGNDTVNCVVANSKNNLVFRDLELTQGLDFGFSFTTCTNVYVTDCDAHDCGNDNLIFITDCHDCIVTGGEFYNAYERVATTITTGIEIADGCYDITIRGVTCRNNAGDLGVGITVHSHDAQEMPYNITLSDCICHANAVYGIQVLKQDDTEDSNRNIIIADCTVYDNTADGIRVWKSGGASNYPNGVTIEGCYVYGNTTYAYYVSGVDIKVRRNVFNGQGLLHTCVDLDFYNNTMYFVYGTQWRYPLFVTNAGTEAVRIKNNITYVTTALDMVIGVDASVSAGEVDIDYNLYYLDAEAATANRWHWLGAAKNWANWLADTGMDANSPAADQDPLFVNPGAGDFTLQAGSPAIDAGVDVGFPFEGSAPDLGYMERE